MSRRWKVLIAGATVAVLVPVSVVLARGFEGTQFFSADQSTHDLVGQQTTNSKQFQPLDGTLNFSSPGAGAVITLSADMVKVKAAFKFVSEDFDPQPVPEPAGGVTFVGPGANAYAFFDSDGCDNFSVQWARVGNKPAKLNQASVIGVGDSSAC